MKKILAVLLSIVMAFSVVAIPASAIDASIDDAQNVVGTVTDDAKEAIDSAKDLFDSFEAKDFEVAVDNVFDFAVKLAEAIHTLVHSLSQLFDFDCPFCDDKAEKPADPEVPEEPTEPEEPTDPEEPTEPEVPEEPVFPEVPTDPAEPVHPENAIYLTTVDEAEEAIANAEDGAYIVLADGLYDELVITKSNITISANNAVVGFLNFNAKHDVTVIGLTFDAAFAKEVMNSNKAGASGFFANVVGTQIHTKSDAHDITIKDCKFTGTPVNADNYRPICINDYKRSGTHAYDVTVEGCIFEVSANYYLYFNYFQQGSIIVKNNVLGGEEYSCAGMMWLSSNGSDLEITDNTIYNWKNDAIGTSRSGAKYDITVKIENNAFVQVAEGASTSTLYLKNYKDTDLVTLGTLFGSGNTYYGTISAETAKILK